MKAVDKVELLAPAGCEEAFYGAIHAGADAVYLGGNRFGARAYADNFTEEQLLACIRYAHLFGRKVYLTVNTLVKESEFGELLSYLRPLYEAELDGVIVQDVGVFAYIREHFPGLPLHASTQMTITGENGAMLLKSMGACRIVPARELSLRELVEIKSRTDLEIEVFIHGAMCYCYSGQCLFSSILGGRSGNRGRCAQPCRLPYSTEESRGEIYPLSLKDMCTVEHLPELVEAGIDSFKIEGRMKKPEYAAGVTAIYRKYIDKYYNMHSSSQKENPGEKFFVEKEDLESLSSLYIRSERQDGYFYKQNGKDMITLHSPAYSGTDENLLARIRAEYIESRPHIPVAVFGSFLTGKPAAVTLSAGKISVTAKGEEVQQAHKQPITLENVEKQLGKLGDSIFSAGQMQAEVSPDAFYPLKQINELRREAVLLLEDALLAKNGYGKKRQAAYAETVQPDAPQKKTVQRDAVRAKNAVSLRTLAQLRAVLENSLTPDRIYVDGDLLLADQPKIRTEVFLLCKKAAAESRIFVSLPYILRSSDTCYLNTLYEMAEKNSDIFSGFLVRSLEGLGFLKEKACKSSIYTDAGVYVWNRAAFAELSAAGGISGFCMPYELNGAEQREIWDFPCEKVIYGRIPMMITANCVSKTAGRCRKGEKPGKNRQETEMTYLTDRYGTNFPVLLNCAHCTNVIYNSVPLSLRKEMPKWEGKCTFRFDFTLEEEADVHRILDYFSGRTEKEPFSAHTTGHEKRGVL